MTGGESGIRTHVRVSPKHAFQACAFSHSAISPANLGWKERLLKEAVLLKRSVPLSRKCWRVAALWFFSILWVKSQKPQLERKNATAIILARKHEENQKSIAEMRNGAIGIAAITKKVFRKNLHPKEPHNQTRRTR